MQYKPLITLLFLIACLKSAAQTHSSLAQKQLLFGVVSDASGQALSGVTIMVEEPLVGTTTNTKGEYEVFLKEGKYTLVISSIGYETKKLQVEIDAKATARVDIDLMDAIRELESVEITSNALYELKQAPQSISLINTKQFSSQHISINDLFNRTAGIRVRQQGGLGSDAAISINGISGKQIKIFIDGIPIENYGSAWSLNVLSVNAVDRLEIYKGVVPIHLGADALGGAINIILRDDYKTFLEATYTHGSFDTNMASFNTSKIFEPSNVVVRLNSFYNYSANDYKIDVEIPDEFGTPRKATVKRFHDHFQNYAARLEAGFINKTWADISLLSASFSGLTRNLQHDPVMSQPYGKVKIKQQSLTLGYRYKKDDILRNTNLDIYAGYNFIKDNLTDTTFNAYTWDGNVYTKRQQGGEISGTMNLLTLNTLQGVARINLQHNLSQHFQIELNGIVNDFSRSGNDPVAAQYYGEDIFKNETSSRRITLGMALTSKFLDEKLTMVTSLKQFNFRSKGFLVELGEVVKDDQQVSNWGWNHSMKYQFTASIYSKLSYEYASRLPDAEELFGNYYYIRPNPMLIPEQSHNANVSFHYKGATTSAELGGFYRKTNDNIYLLVSRFYAQYQNLLRAETKGIEFEGSLVPVKNLTTTISATFQDIRNKSANANSGTVDDRYYNARLPNIPYFFCNVNVAYQFNKIFNSNDKLQLALNSYYVNEFYLYWAVDGSKDTKLVVPTQFIQDVNLTYTPVKDKFSVSLDVNNLLNNKAYDNFNVQKPGRAIYIKLKTLIK